MNSAQLRWQVRSDSGIRTASQRKTLENNPELTATEVPSNQEGNERRKTTEKPFKCVIIVEASLHVFFKDM